MRLIKTITTVIFLMLIQGRVFTQQKTVLPTREQIGWADAEIGVIIHLDMNIFAPDSYVYGKKETLPSLNLFNPSSLNTDQWVAAAQSAGAKYAVLVVKHNTGFSLWPTKAHDYSIKNTPWKNGKGDVLEDFLKSCKKYHIKPGIYYSVNSNTLYGAENNGKMDSASRKKYNAIAITQLKELWGTYGKFFEIWFDGGILPSKDGGFSDDISFLINKYQPEAMLFQGPYSSKNLIRWVGNEEGIAPYPFWSRADSTTSSNGLVQIGNLNGDPNGNLWCPAEADFPSRRNSAWEGGWFWRADRSDDVITVNELLEKYHTSVGRNANMLIGMAIDTSGKFPAKETKLFNDFGDSVKAEFSHALCSTKGSGNEFILQLGKQATACNEVVLEEDISKGENIRQFIMEAFVNNKWIKIFEGSSVGHKLIYRFNTIVATKFRIRIEKSEGKVFLKKATAYYHP